MTIEKRHYRDANRTTVVQTECPACEQELEEGEGFAEHWREECPENPLHKVHD